MRWDGSLFRLGARACCGVYRLDVFVVGRRLEIGVCSYVCCVLLYMSILKEAICLWFAQLLLVGLI